MPRTIVEEHEASLAKRISEFALPRTLKYEEFEAIAKFVTVADELAHEPFMSEDCRDGLSFSGAERVMRARFGHPAFLKSAMLPFRKLWMVAEPCHYESVRDIIFEVFAETSPRGTSMFPRLDGWRQYFFEMHASALNRPVDARVASEKIRTTKDVIDIWIYTHGVHTGKSKKHGRFTLRDFDEALKHAGRAYFESEFRSSMRLIGFNSYLSFLRIIARPAFSRLLELGYTPSFETQAALKFSAYPKVTDQIILHDPFWHPDKETEEETFDRLIRRQNFSNFSTFFSGYYFARRPALEALKSYQTFEEFLKATGATIVTEKPSNLQMQSDFSAIGDFNNNGGRVTVYQDKTVLFEGRSRFFLGHYYEKFREAFFSHRATIPNRGSDWDQNYWGS